MRTKLTGRLRSHVAVARVLVALLLVLAGAFRDATPAQAATVQVTVALYRVVEVRCGEGAGEACPDDYYPKFEIDHQGLFDGKDDFCCAHSTDFRTNWVRQATVDTTHSPIDIHLELWDQDDLSPDNAVDIANGGDYLDIKFDLSSCVFTGSGLTTQQGANFPTLAGESEGSGGDAARVYFTITTPACLDLAKTVDSDGDGIMNAWETPGSGLDINNDGTIDLALGDAPYNAVPYRKDVFVEVDWMECVTADCILSPHSHKPQPGALDDVVKAFAEAPVDSFVDPSDGKTKFRGVSLHAMLDEAVPDVIAIQFKTDGGGTLDDFNDIKNGNPVAQNPGACSGRFGFASDRSSQNCVNILNAKRQVFRYAIFGHTYAENTDSSGIAELDPDKGGNDFMVTLGSFSSSTITKIGGQRVADASTFMHELGHTLGLDHGGHDPTNCKPNYLSVMNYTLQFPRADPTRPLDYASAFRGTALGAAPGPGLDEAHLNENNGVGGTPANPGRTIVFGIGGKLKTLPATNGPTDWNGVNGNTEGDIPANINFIESIGDPGDVFACNNPTQVNNQLNGYDDWAHLVYNFRDSKYFSDGAGRPDLPSELTQRIVRAMSAQADLAVTKSVDKVVAVGGDTLAYTVAVTDLGPGPQQAVDISWTDTLPDNTTVQRSVPNLSKGQSDTQQVSYLVPCTTADGTVLTNRVTVTGSDQDGVPDPYTVDNTASATTKVQAPKLSVSKTATAAVNAGEAITYTITYANTGSGGAANVTIADTVPAGVYYSEALDLGIGPKPTSVTLNGDGTRTLVWNVGTVAAQSGDQKIVFAARPTLLALAGTTYTNSVSLAFKNASGACTYAPVTASASTTITVVPPTRDPLSMGYWKNHPEQWTSETLARIQATDQHYDTNHDGALSSAEATSAFQDNNEAKSVLLEQLLGTYFNLATRRINAATVIDSKTAKSLSLATVRDAVLSAGATLSQPVNAATSPGYSSTITVLDEINANKSEVY